MTDMPIMKLRRLSDRARMLRRRKLSRCAFVIAIFLSFSTEASHADSADGYPALLSRVRQRDLTVDFGALRRAYAQTANYHPEDPAMGALRREMDRDFDSGDRAGAVQIAKHVLALDYVDIEAHRVLERSGASCADFHRTVADRLTQSILDSGDGKSPATAYSVLSTDEEYAVLDRLALQAAAQSLVERDGHHYDVLLVLRDKGKPFEIYFNVDLPLAAPANGGAE
jgi:hypothetical protein